MANKKEDRGLTRMRPEEMRIHTRIKEIQEKLEDIERHISSSPVLCKAESISLAGETAALASDVAVWEFVTRPLRVTRRSKARKSE